MFLKQTLNLALKSPVRGFSLIEVLVTMLILSIGLMGIAALQFKGLQYNQDAYFRTQINILAYDLADRMRSNRENVSSYATASYSVPTSRPPGCVQSTGPDAANDLTCWKAQVFDSLPPGTVVNVVTPAASPGNPNPTNMITIAWTDRSQIIHSVEFNFRVNRI